MEAIYHPTTDELELRRKRPDEARALRGEHPLSLRLELRGDEVVLVLTPLREGWLPFLQAAAMAPEKPGEEPAWQNLPSSMISAVRYHEDRQILEVAFNKGVCLYFGVPREVFEGLLRAESKGRYMRQHGIDRYPWIKKSRLRPGPDRAPL
ncbi:MAG: KTSC domain-containing protein [Anaerolineae bacterium]|nr:KTSC domain-containing protein [Anaerolineae bacterium]